MRRYLEKVGAAIALALLAFAVVSVLGLICRGITHAAIEGEDHTRALRALELERHRAEIDAIERGDL